MSFTGWGSSNFIRCPSGIITAAPVTIACWFKLTSNAAIQQLVSLNTSGAATNRHSFSIFTNASTDFRARTADGVSGGNAIVTTTMTTGVWHFGCGVFTSATSRKAFFNASSATDTTSKTPSGIDRASIGVDDGSAAGNPTTSTTLIAEVGYWSAALDDAEVASLAAGFSPLLIRPQSLVAYLPLVRDLVGYKGNAFAIQGSLSAADHPRIFFPGA